VLVWFILLLMGSAIVYNILGLVYKSPAFLMLSFLISVFLVYAGGFYTVSVPTGGVLLQVKERELMWFFGSVMTVINGVFAVIFATTDFSREVERRWKS